jgi:hypothetical protein
MISSRTTTLISEIWADLRAAGDLGGARRVDEKHPSDFYGALDSTGRPGLVLVTSREPPPPPVFEVVEVTVHHRLDGRWSLGIWLRTDLLSPLFGRLCEDLVEATRGVTLFLAPGYVLTRLVRWRRLLEAGDSAVLGAAELRGLLGELIVLQRLLALWPVAVVVESWVGPLDAPQDFTLPFLRIESKAIRPGARTIRITSADQLDVDEVPLLLSVATLASDVSGVQGFTPASVVQAIRTELNHLGTEENALEFESRLAAAGYVDLPEYDRIAFRVEAIRFFEVRDDFPRLRRGDLPYGVAEAAYEISLGACGAFVTEFEKPSHGT